ncbi:tRNA (cytidine(34)-2'-O)-methyltransferase [Longimicrobium sp.]|uniref:tRNA (cytidine(34)-2'-O)-methyltransferase n=1 Tax=Longimicrobium sp. TaxID=2029185 RepID=UPI002E36493C|nr:tRNA (cytidine(34)-2'-O)-methyltransferase [Longimicrobium sp.]HEX6041080.1 tRNA (cytidine(34)-2'-O)-methyltransferase [Longimicrobium sp.]
MSEDRADSGVLPLAEPIHVALFEPEIPGNAGNVARLCSATGSPLHLIGRLGFSFSHPKAKRAVMDYWDGVDWTHHVAWEDFASAVASRTVWMLTTKAQRTIWDAPFAPGDVLLLGPESRGLPDALLEADPARCLRIPMVSTARSLNLGSSASIALYEALRRSVRGAPPS